MTPRYRRQLRTAPPALVVTVGAALLLSLAACSSDASGADGADAPDAAAEGSAISTERCAENEAAGTITYITGYQYQSSAGILEALAADSLGYFDALCLDVEIQPGTGDTAANAQLVAAGTAQVTSLGNDAEALKAVAGGIDVTGIATWGHVPIATLMTSTEITDLTQLEGTTLGHKGSLPAPLRAMLVEEGVDLAAIELVEVGYDPTVLPRGQVQSLTGYKSNEPLLLAAMGEDITEWNPEDYGISGSFGTIVANPAFAAEHPTAVEDYLRATVKALDYCVENGEECVGFAADVAESGYDSEHNLKIWETESGLVADSTPEGSPVGFHDEALTTAEGEALVASGELDTLPTVSDVFDPSFLEAVYDGTELVWPAP
ncbi:ABC transporter substrate-binding protein [Sanguibacter sp. 25GB23B1]|uniref:ABC transporter substrate-binding protein n=1 Tax=unclassified Sanguibacter TaxID=2645534 RepID=UPI0032AFB843